MYDELVKRLKEEADCPDNYPEDSCLMREAADAIEELSAKIESLQNFADNISKLPDCNTCLKKTMCEYLPKLGDYCRINCPAWIGVPEPPKEET